ncbi:MAG: anaerobic ribonucleoside-triphosphate reductase activating protein [Clostridia bacterium]|nr:anaerobic ribonucleoside-triphosphate reductase activating protein [Clostridia bacterium]
MIIKGFQKLTLLDFPGRAACTVFTAGCNFRCPFCHNASLVLGNEGERIAEEEVFDLLERRRGRLSGVCITGGEPTLQPDLEAFIRRVRDMGYLVKLDTNGYRPDVLEGLLTEGLLDYVAMDIKNCRESYARTTGLELIDIGRIEKSVELLMGAKSNPKIPASFDFEFRTTVVKELHTEEDFRNIGEWLMGEEKYFLQQFVDSGDLIMDGLNGYDKNYLSYLVNMLKAKIPNTAIRG